jgi:hypothetical protein
MRNERRSKVLAIFHKTKLTAEIYLKLQNQYKFRAFTYPGIKLKGTFTLQFKSQRGLKNMAPALNTALPLQSHIKLCRLGNARKRLTTSRVGLSVHAAPMALRLGVLQRQQVLCMSSGKDTNSEQQTNGAANVC